MESLAQEEDSRSLQLARLISTMHPDQLKVKKKIKLKRMVLTILIYLLLMMAFLSLLIQKMNFWITLQLPNYEKSGNRVVL